MHFHTGYAGLVLSAAALAACGASLPEERATTVEPEPRYTRPQGPVRVALTALLIAPGKDSGLPWDGPGRLPADVANGLRHVARDSMGRAFRQALFAAAPGAALVEVLPWATNAFISGIEAPDVQAVVLLNGRPIGNAPKIQDAYRPSWAAAYSRTVRIGEDDQLEVHAVDVDVAFDDEIGNCTARGMPAVDEQGYAAPASFRCFGQVWDLALRVVPSDGSDEGSPPRPAPSRY